MTRPDQDPRHDPGYAPYTPDLSVGSLLRRSWPLFKEHLGLLVGAFAVYALLIGMGSSPASSSSSSEGLLGLIAFIITGPLTVGLYGIALRIHRHEPVVFPDLFEGFRDFGRAFGVHLLTSLGIMVGLIFLLVPGIILMVAWWPALFLVYDDEFGVLDTLREAWAMTRGHRVRLFVLGVALVFVFFAGLLFFIVGALITGPLVVLVAAAAYEELALADV